jgi:hypothetical protein
LSTPAISLLFAPLAIKPAEAALIDKIISVEVKKEASSAGVILMDWEIT